MVYYELRKIMIMEVIYQTIYFLFLIVVATFYIEVIVDKITANIELLISKWVITFFFIIMNFILLWKTTTVATYFINALK